MQLHLYIYRERERHTYIRTYVRTYIHISKYIGLNNYIRISFLCIFGVSETIALFQRCGQGIGNSGGPYVIYFDVPICLQG